MSLVQLTLYYWPLTGPDRQCRVLHWACNGDLRLEGLLRYESREAGGSR